MKYFTWFLTNVGWLIRLWLNVFSANLASYESRFCLVTQRSSCDSSIQEVACPSGYKRSRPSPTIGGQQWQLLLLDVFFSFVRLVNNIKQIRHLNTLRVSSIKKSDCTLPTRNKKNWLRKKNDTQSDGFDITVEGPQTAIFYGNFLAFS